MSAHERRDDEAFRAVSAAYRKLSQDLDALERKHEEARQMILNLAEALKKTDAELAEERRRADSLANLAGHFERLWKEAIGKATSPDDHPQVETARAFVARIGQEAMEDKC